MAHYERNWRTATPGLLIILLDQSGSMMNAYGGTTRAGFASNMVNKVIDYIIQINFNIGFPRNRCFISVIGYNHNVKELCSGWLKDLDASPLRYDTLKMKVPDGTGGVVEIEVKQPVWVEPIAEGDCANMRDGFKMAKKLVEDWITDNQDGPAPVVINISEGVPHYDGLSVETCIKETTEVAKQVINIQNSDGNTLLFNVGIGDGRHKIIAPASEYEVLPAGEPAQFLYDISSDIPDSYKCTAYKNEMIVKAESRGFVFDAEAIELLKLIDFC